MNKNLFLLSPILILLFIVACTPQTITITKYQCQNGEVVDSIELCEAQKCPICPQCPQKICETVREPYVDVINEDYSYNYWILDERITGNIIDVLDWGTYATTKIKNLENNAGEFTVIHNYRTLKKQGKENQTKIINGSSIAEFATTFNTDLGEDVEVTTEVIAPTGTKNKEVIKYKEVERCYCE